ncbi:hypothetical protein GPALN_003422 [Globodera pallida]|nr:hypothetical protein GPALN_003422 [Globodera pallida]
MKSLLIVLICFFSTIYPITNTSFGGFPKGFLTSKGASNKPKGQNIDKIQTLRKINEQNCGESSINVQKMQNPLNKSEKNDEEIAKTIEGIQISSNLNNQNIGEKCINSESIQFSHNENEKKVGENSKKAENMQNDQLKEQCVGENAKNKIQILSKYNENPKEEVKIRVINRIANLPRHAYVVVGNYEYDFLLGGARRRKFRHDINVKLDNSNKKKVQSFKQKKLFVPPKKAEEVFFEMSKRFWHAESFSESKANCLDFVFNFVCALFDGNCPKKKLWPNNFVELDADMPDEYAKLDELRFPASVFERQPISLPVVNDPICKMKDHHLEFRIKNFECNSNGDENCSKFVLFYLTGRFTRTFTGKMKFETAIFVETEAEKVWENGENVHLNAVLKAYSCKQWENNSSMSIVSNLLIMNETTRKYIKPKNVCHSHNVCACARPINLDEITDHIVDIEFDRWDDINLD